MWIPLCYSSRPSFPPLRSWHCIIYILNRSESSVLSSKYSYSTPGHQRLISTCAVRSPSYSQKTQNTLRRKRPRHWTRWRCWKRRFSGSSNRNGLMKVSFPGSRCCNTLRLTSHRSWSRNRFCPLRAHFGVYAIRHAGNRRRRGQDCGCDNSGTSTRTERASPYSSWETKGEPHPF
jgi:hypothetical protein